MDNYAIADQFSLLGKLMDIHGENSFKAKSYSSAAFTIEKLELPLAGLPESKILKIRGIGDSVGKKVVEIIETGELKALQELVAKTPAGVLEMMNIKGLGPKKINTLWKEMDIDTIEALEEACRENRIAQKKGFGEKTEQKILESIEFVRSNKGKFLYKQIEDFALALQQKIEQKFPGEAISVTGEFRRQLEIISQLEWVTTATKDELKNYLINEQIQILSEDKDMLILCAENFLTLHFHLTTKKSFANKLIETSCSDEFLAAWKSLSKKEEGEKEEELFKSAGLNFIPPYLRETSSVLKKAKKESFDDVVEMASIKGLIHSHSNWSDGAYN